MLMDVGLDVEANVDVKQAARVRQATPADATVIAQLCHAHAAYERAEYSNAGHAQRLAAALQRGELHGWLALRDGEPVGYATATVDFSTFSGYRYLHLDCLYLATHARGLGLGRELLLAVRRFGVTKACTNLQWQTPAWNQRAMRFYDRTGAQRYVKQRYIWNV